jgi:hypothetical protein
MVNFADQWGSQDQNEGSAHKADWQLESILKSNVYSAERQREPGEAKHKTIITQQTDPVGSITTDYNQTGQDQNNTDSDQGAMIQGDRRDNDAPYTQGKVSARDKRQLEKSQSTWARDNRKAAPEGSVGIVKKTAVPRDNSESPERKKRAAPSPEQTNNTDEDESSMTSSGAGDIANAVINQIQEAPKEAKAPSGPRKDV